MNALIFKGMNQADIEQALHCLSPVRRSYKKGSYIYRQGDFVREVGLVQEGSVHIVREDFMGERNILQQVGRGGMFGESYACQEKEPLSVSVEAAQDAEILFLDVGKVFSVCSNGCAFHKRLVQNFLTVLAEKNLMLTRKMEHITKKSTREKLLSYLYEEAFLQKSREFDIAFDRQQLADYLAVDRSALSAEMSRMHKDGLISYRKNHFKLQNREN